MIGQPSDWFIAVSGIVVTALKRQIWGSWVCKQSLKIAQGQRQRLGRSDQRWETRRRTWKPRKVCWLLSRCEG